MNRQPQPNSDDPALGDDPVVVEVRKAREAYAEQFNFDLRAIFEDIQKRQNASDARYVEPPAASSHPTSKRAG